MSLRFVFLLITRIAAWLRLSRREEAWKTAEILILRHQLAVLQRRQPHRPKLNWADRALIATLLSVLPKARRHGLRLLVTPDTILRWHRDIVGRRWAARSMRGKTGRPATRRNIQALGCRLARENPRWGYRRIHGEMAGLGVKVATSTVWEILKASGIDPARRTGPTWFSVPALSGRRNPGERLFRGRPARRYPGLCPSRNRARQQAHPHPRSHSASHRGVNRAAGPQPSHGPRRTGAPGRFMIRDRGSNFTTAFDAVLADAGIRTVLCNVRTPRMNAIAERWIGGCRRELLDRTLVWNQGHLRRILREYEAHHSAPTSPLAARISAPETATRASRPRPVPRPKTGMRRWPDQRISPGRMTWTRFSAPQSRLNRTHPPRA